MVWLSNLIVVIHIERDEGWLGPLKFKQYYYNDKNILLQWLVPIEKYCCDCFYYHTECSFNLLFYINANPVILGGLFAIGKDMGMLNH